MTKGEINLKRWRENPAVFVNEVFGVEPDKWQLKALEAFPSQAPDKLRLSLQACAGPGKSAVLAWCGWNFLACYGERGDHPKGAAVSVTADNLKDNLWPEFAKWQGRSEFLTGAFQWTKERIFARDHSETWFLSARSWSKTSNADEQGRTLSGLHSGYVLVLVDESGEIPVSVLKAAEQTVGSSKWVKIMQAGNPTSQEGMLYAAASELRDLWHIIRITGDPDDPDRSPRIDVKWAQQQIKTYGRDNPWVMAYILGQFPGSSLNTLLSPDEVAAAMKKHLRPDQYDFAQKRLGIDAARFGLDPWVIFPRQGLASFKPTEMRNPRSHEVAARVASAKLKWGSELEFFDGTGGFAAGAIDSMIQAGHAPMEISFSGKAIDPRYFNKRSEMWFLMAEWVKRGGALPNHPVLAKELTTPTYTFQNGKFRLEEKDQIKQRLGFSPNYADALCLTFALPEMPRGSEFPLVGEQQRKIKSEYDPYNQPEKDDRARVDYDPFDSSRL